MDEFYIGQTFDKETGYPPAAANWCNENGTCHIEENEDGMYEIVENYRIDDPDDPFVDGDDDSMPYMELQELVEETYLMTEYNTILIEQLMEG